MNDSAVRSELSQRINELRREHNQQLYTRTDRMFAVLLLIQWLASIAGALWLSPRTWAGTEAQIHPHLWLAIFGGSALCSLPIFLVWLVPGHFVTRHTIAISQVMFSSLLIHISGGRIETHFHVFGSLAFLASYRDWKLLLPATLVVAADHFFRGIYWPESVFGVISASPWRWMEHAGWVVFEDVFLIISIRQSVAEESAVAVKSAELEWSHSQLKHAKELADQSNQAKSEFLANMSHEIRTPLAGILGYAEILRRGVGTPEQRETYLRTIQSSGQHLLTLINDILDLSKIEAGRMECEHKACSPCEILSDVLSVMRVRAQEKGLRLICEWNTAVPETIVTDPARVRQMLMNLVGNAIKFTHRGSVSIRAGLHTTGPRPMFLFEVHDTGIGIRPEHLEMIFLPFNQADNSITREFGGTGLGLAICRHLALELGGEISVESQPDRGSIFRFTIDIGTLDGIKLLNKPFHEALRTAPESPPSQLSALPSMRVLLVDDGETNRDLISLVLTTAGANVVCAENGQVALKIAGQEPFDLILMDMQMPVMDGYTATRQLRARGYQRPILALTAHAMRGDQEKCLAAGCSGYLSKPVQIDRLLEQVRTATNQLPVASPTPEPVPESELVPERIYSSLPTELPRFQQLVERFTVSLSTKLEKMRTALQNDNWTELAELAHWLKGSGGTVGFDCLTAPATRLEQYAKQTDQVAARKVLDKLDELADRICCLAH